jgi:membrane protein implicated in regulation of membrane protease activity
MSLTAWITISIIFIIFEMITQSFFFFFCLSIGSLFASFVSYFEIFVWIEFIVFIIVSIISVYFIKPILRNVFYKHNVASNIDSIIGCDAVVVEEVIPLKYGFVKISGEVWRAKSNVKFEVGDIAKIESIDGTTVIIKK